MANTFLNLNEEEERVVQYGKFHFNVKTKEDAIKEMIKRFGETIEQNEVEPPVEQKDEG